MEDKALKWLMERYRENENENDSQIGQIECEGGALGRRNKDLARFAISIYSSDLVYYIDLFGFFFFFFYFGVMQFVVKDISVYLCAVQTQ